MYSYQWPEIFHKIKGGEGGETFFLLCSLQYRLYCRIIIMRKSYCSPLPKILARKERIVFSMHILKESHPKEFSKGEKITLKKLETVRGRRKCFKFYFLKKYETPMGGGWIPNSTPPGYAIDRYLCINYMFCLH